MDFGLDELKQGPGPGKGVAAPPDIDVRGYLLAMMAQHLAAQQTAGAPRSVPATPR